MLSHTLKTHPAPAGFHFPHAAPLPYALTASSVKLVQTNVFVCNNSHYIAGSLLDSRLPVM
jgi:hypothetical protein